MIQTRRFLFATHWARYMNKKMCYSNIGRNDEMGVTLRIKTQKQTNK